MSETLETRTAPGEPDFDSWREPLLASLRDCGTQPAPRYAILRYALALIVMFATVSIASIAGRLMGEILRNAPPPIWFAGHFLLFVFIVAVLSRIRNYFLRQAWQSGARSAEDELRQLGSRRPILYLRSFALDKRLGRPTWMERYLGARPFANTEQRLTASLKKLGPVIAIGRPGEKLPPLGAARFYVADDRWQQKVDDVQKVAQIVLWATGTTAGLKWEIEHLVQNTKPRRLIVWAHPHLLGLSEAKREEEWTKFRESLGQVFPKPLPDKLGSARFFVFDNDWNPTPVAPRVSDAFTEPQVGALKQALLIQQNGASDAERETLRARAAHREPRDFGSLIGARLGPIHWPLAGVLFASLVITALVQSILDRVLLALQFIEYSTTPGFVWTVLDALVTTAALVAAFRFIRISALAALAAAAVITPALFILSFNWFPHEEQSWGGMFLGRLLVPFLQDCALFALLVWTVRRWTRLAVALWGAAFFASLVAMILAAFQQTFEFGDFGFGSIPEAIGITVEKLGYALPRGIMARVFKATIFAGVYVGLLKLLPLVGLDERRPTSPQPA